MSARYMSKNRLLALYVESSVSLVWSDKTHATFDACISVVCPALYLGILRGQEPYLFVTVGLYLLTGRDCLEYTGHSNFEFW